MRASLRRNSFWLLSLGLTITYLLAWAPAENSENIPTANRDFTLSWGLTLVPWFCLELFREIDSNYELRVLARFETSLGFAANWFTRTFLPWYLATATLSFAVGFLTIDQRLKPLSFFSQTAFVPNQSPKLTGPQLSMTGWEVFSQTVLAYGLLLFAFALIATFAASLGWRSEKLFLLVLALGNLRYLIGFGPWVQTPNLFGSTTGGFNQLKVTGSPGLGILLFQCL